MPTAQSSRTAPTSWECSEAMSEETDDMRQTPDRTPNLCRITAAALAEWPNVRRGQAG